jgi:hypothetical protein
VGPAPQVLLLCLGGLVSIIPLWLFAIASRSLRLADLGFFQYLLPTTQFVLAVTVYAQPISFDTLASLAIIWIGMGIVVKAALRCTSAGRRLPVQVQMPTKFTTCFLRGSMPITSLLALLATAFTAALARGFSGFQLRCVTANTGMRYRRA